MTVALLRESVSSSHDINTKHSLDCNHELADKRLCVQALNRRSKYVFIKATVVVLLVSVFTQLNYLGLQEF